MGVGLDVWMYGNGRCDTNRVASCWQLLYLAAMTSRAPSRLLPTAGSMKRSHEHCQRVAVALDSVVLRRHGGWSCITNALPAYDVH